MSQPEVIAERYELLTEIGQGGMGKVYKSRDIKTGELVAVKALKPDVIESDPSMVERFDREGEALRRLNHPNMVRVLANIEENDAHYLVMDYVSGGTLNDLMRHENPMQITTVLNIALDLCDALTRAHRLKILHRDIKPANVLIAEDGTPRLTDFGVARMEDRSRVTEAGMIIGTYNYLSPEAIHGMEPDERSDIWAFGVMLFEMLTNKRPFEQNQVGAIIGSILNDETPDILELRPDIPPQLAELVYSMLEKDRDRRISSARQIGVAVEDIIRAVDSNAIPIASSLKQQVEQGTRFDMTPTADRPGGSTEPGVHMTSISEDADAALAHVPAGNTPSAFGQTPMPPKGTSYTYTDASGNQFTITASDENKRNRALVLLGLPAILVIVLAIVALAALNGQGGGGEDGEESLPTVMALAGDTTEEPAADSPPDTLQPPPATADGGADSGPGQLPGRGPFGVPGADPASLPFVPSAGDGEIMVMLAVPEFTGDNEADRDNEITRVLNEDLRQKLEMQIDTPLVMRPVPALITSSEEARTWAKEWGATIFIWGSYDENSIELHIDVGNLEKFPHITFDEDFVASTVNVRLRVVDQRSQSIAPHILSMLGLLYGLDGDAYNYMRTVAQFERMGEDPRPELLEGGVSPHIHEAFLLHLEDTGAAIDAANAALELDGSNAFVFSMLSLANARAGNFDAADRDASTALRIGPDGWAVPLYTKSFAALLEGEDQQESVAIFNQIIEMRPDDWYAYALRAGLFFNAGIYVRALEDAEKSIELGPDVSLPYVYATMIAIRQGDLDAARGYANRIVDEYPDPSLLDRVTAATFGDRADPSVILGSSFGWMLVGQPERATADINRLDDEIVEASADLSFLEGMAACAVEEYAEAEDAFQNAIEADNSFALAHVMYASSLGLQGKTGELTDYRNTLIRTLARSPLEGRDIFQAVRNGDISCGTLFAGE